MIKDYFVKGTESHMICQDYASFGKVDLVGKNNIDYVMITDGCSSSPLSERGSMFFHNIVEDSMDSFKFCIDAHPATIMVEMSKNLVETIIEHKNINFDSTVVIAYKIGNNMAFAILGDGFVFFKEKNSGIIHLYEIKFEANAPFYISYYADDDRLQAYINEYGNTKVLLIDHISKKIIDECFVYDFYEDNPIGALRIEIKKEGEDVDLFGVCSDGLDSFIDNDGINIAPIDVLKEMIDFPNFKEDFLKRRGKMFFKKQDKRKNKNEKWLKNMDDFSIAIAKIEEEKAEVGMVCE